VKLSRGALPPPSELALAAVVTAAMVVDLHQASRPGLALLLVLVAGASLAWRLRLPELPLLLICGSNLQLLATAPGEFGPQTVVLGVLVAVYSAAAHLTGRRALLAGAWGLVLVWSSHTVTADGDAGDFFPFVVWGLPWLAGRLVRRQTLRAHHAGAQAALSEADAREAVGRERDRIARELHDVVAHAVSLMVVQAGAERVAASPDPTRTREALESIESTGRQALVELRTMLGVLRGAEGREELVPQPDLTAVPLLVEQVRAAGLDVELVERGSGPVPVGVGLAAYRVVQEGLTNALRHGAGSATVTVDLGEAVQVEIRNPMGAASAEGAGAGLVGMRERVQLFGGTLRVGPESDTWVVHVRLPLVRPV